MKAFLRYLVNKLNDLADWMLYTARVDPEVSYDEYKKLEQERRKLTRIP